MPENLVEGWTEPIGQQLFLDRERTQTLDGTGMTVELVLLDGNDKPVDLAGSTEWLSAADGKARYLPGASDFVASRSPYRARWKVTASGKVAFFPNDEGDKWTVRK